MSEAAGAGPPRPGDPTSGSIRSLTHVRSPRPLPAPRAHRPGSALLAALVLLLLQTGLAFAHATLVSSDPPDGAILATAPSRLTLTFNEPVSPLVLRLIDAKGQATTLAYHLEGNVVVVDQPGALGSGSHVLSWRVISADGHPVGGSVLFSVGARSAGAMPSAPGDVDWLRRAAIWLCRLAIYLGLLIGVGGVFFSTLVGRIDPPPRRIHRVVLVAGMIAVLISVGLQGLDALDAPFSSLGRAIIWQTAMATTYGMSALIALGSLVAAFATTALPPGRPGTTLAGLSFLGVGAALAATGHASAAQPQFLTRPAVFVHALAAAFWIGALLPVGAALRRGNGASVLTRFSELIPFAIVPLGAAGIALAVVQVGRPDALWTTGYGTVLLIKLALVSVLFVLAAVNRWHLTKRSGLGDAAATRKLVLAIFAEIALAVAILGVVATWRFTPPPRAMEAAAGQPASVHLHTSRAMAEVTIAPGRVGTASASIALATGDLKPLDAREVTLILANPAAGIEPIRRAATRTDDGTWRVNDLVIPVAGRWSIEIALLVSEFELVRLKETVEIHQ